MADYRADIVEADGTVVRTIELVCPNDDSAIEHANSLGYPAIELWRDGRQIAKISHKPQIRVTCASRGGFLPLGHGLHIGMSRGINPSRRLHARFCPR